MHALRYPHRLVMPLLVLLSMSAEAAVIYRWIDRQGQTHFSDVVPDQYRQVAEPVDPATNPPTPAQRQRAIDDAAQRKARAAALPSPASQPAAASPQAAASAPAASKRPSRVPTDATDCDSWRNLYDESMACFGPYRTVNGTKAEAFEHCTPVLEPPIRCQRNAR